MCHLIFCHIYIVKVMVPHILKKAEISNNKPGVHADNFDEPKSQALEYFKDSHIFSFCHQRKAA